MIKDFWFRCGSEIVVACRKVFLLHLLTLIENEPRKWIQDPQKPKKRYTSLQFRSVHFDPLFSTNEEFHKRNVGSGISFLSPIYFFLCQVYVHFPFLYILPNKIRQSFLWFSFCSMTYHFQFLYSSGVMSTIFPSVCRSLTHCIIEPNQLEPRTSRLSSNLILS